MAKKPWEQKPARTLAFVCEWSRLADAGAVDDLGGAEFRRVQAEWYAAGKPGNLTAFLQLRANYAPLTPSEQ